jgi:hypothetical protein
MLEKYKPTKFSEIIGNKTSIQTLGRWLLTWPSVSNCVLVSGSCGVGKTLSIELLTKQPEYNVMEVNSDDERNEGFIQSRVYTFVKTKKNIWGKSNILIVNDVDVSNDNGFLGALSKCVKETKIPIILTCNDRYEPKIKTLATLCTDIKFFKPTSQEICRYITEIVKKELNLSRLTNYHTQLIQTATETADGDVRNAILNTEFAIICDPSPVKKGTPIKKLDNKKDKNKPNLFELTTNLMSQMTDFVDKIELFNMEKDLLPLMVYENYPQNIIKTKTTQEELYHLSFASNGMSDYDLLPYEYNSVAILTITEVCHPKSKINFTGYLGKMSSKTKKSNVITELESKVRLPVGHFRFDYLSYMLLILYNQINSPKDFVDKCLSYGFTKEDIQDNLSVILITEGPYERCNYSGVDKKIKASLTKMFSKPVTEESTKTSTSTKSLAKKKTKEEKEPKKTSTPKSTNKKSKKVVTEIVTPVEIIPVIKEQEVPPTPLPSPTPPSPPPPQKTTATIFRRKAPKESLPVDVEVEIPTQVPITESSPMPIEKKTKTIVRKKSSKNTT